MRVVLISCSAALLAAAVFSGCGDSTSRQHGYFTGTWSYVSGTGPGLGSPLIVRSDGTFASPYRHGSWEPMKDQPNPLGPPRKRIRLTSEDSKPVPVVEDAKGVLVGESGAAATYREVVEEPPAVPSAGQIAGEYFFYSDDGAAPSKSQLELRRHYSRGGGFEIKRKGKVAARGRWLVDGDKFEELQTEIFGRPDSSVREAVLRGDEIHFKPGKHTNLQVFKRLR